MFNEMLLTNIVAWVGGQTVVRGITTHIVALLDRLAPQLHKVWGYLVSVSLSVALTGVYLWGTAQFTPRAFVLYSVAVWATASGIYDSQKQKGE